MEEPDFLQRSDPELQPVPRRRSTLVRCSVCEQAPELGGGSSSSRSRSREPGTEEGQSQLQLLLARCSALEEENSALRSQVLQNGQETNGHVSPRPLRRAPAADPGDLDGLLQELQSSSQRLAQQSEELSELRARLVFSSAAADETPIQELVERLRCAAAPVSDVEEVAALCSRLADRLPYAASAAEVKHLVDVLLSLLAQLEEPELPRAGHPRAILMNLLQLMCVSPAESLRELPEESLRAMFRELRRSATLAATWLHCLDGWAQQLQLADAVGGALLSSSGTPGLALRLLEEAECEGGGLADCPAMADCLLRLRARDASEALPSELRTVPIHSSPPVSPAGQRTVPIPIRIDLSVSPLGKRRPPQTSSSPTSTSL